MMTKTTVLSARQCPRQSSLGGKKGFHQVDVPIVKGQYDTVSHTSTHTSGAKRNMQANEFVCSNAKTRPKRNWFASPGRGSLGAIGNRHTGQCKSTISHRSAASAHTLFNFCIFDCCEGVLKAGKDSLLDHRVNRAIILRRALNLPSIHIGRYRGFTGRIPLPCIRLVCR